MYGITIESVPLGLNGEACQILGTDLGVSRKLGYGICPKENINNALLQFIFRRNCPRITKILSKVFQDLLHQWFVLEHNENLCMY